MARMRMPPSSHGYVNEFERKVVETLLTGLGHEWVIVPNFQIKPAHSDALEYDVVAFGPHLVYVIESKDWRGRLSGDDTEWLLNNWKAMKCPLWLVNQKCKVLKSAFGAGPNPIKVEPALVVPEGTNLSLGGQWARHTQTLGTLVDWLQHPMKVLDPNRPLPSLPRATQDQLIDALEGQWGRRQRETPTRIGPYQVKEVIATDKDGAVYLARHALLEDRRLYRIRTFRLGDLSGDALEQRKNVIRRHAEALGRIGPHDHLVPLLGFDFEPDKNQFVEITEWSDTGTLHGYLNNPQRMPLTLRERLEIALGIAKALAVIHAADVVHRNLTPSAVLLDFHRRPRLGDFDRAYLEDRQTVFVETQRPATAFTPPELEDATDYDFDASADLYSFGVIIYQLLADRLPWADPAEARKKRGRPDPAPSAVQAELDPRLDELVFSLVELDATQRPAAFEVVATLEAVLDPSASLPPQVHVAKPASVVSKVGDRFAEGAVLDNQYRVERLVGRGAFSRVFKVHNWLQQRDFAMKVIEDAANVDLVQNEFNALAPRLGIGHPNLVRLHWVAVLTSPPSLPYLLYDFIEGETLEDYANQKKKLAWSELSRIGKESLEGLAFLHARDIYHRDIKPANLMLELPSQRLKIIDLNIAALADKAAGDAGTARYWAPDRGEPWSPHADLFALGIVLWELSIGRHPFPNGRSGRNITPYEPVDLEPGLHPALAAFLTKAVQPDRAHRFHTATEMLAAWRAIPGRHAPPPPLVNDGIDGDLRLEAWERNRADYNPYVTRLLTLYSQARRTNSGTRGLDDIGRVTYVDTRLDTELAERIANGEFRLVIVSGNAGDGKTAFLQQVEARFRDLGVVVAATPRGNGSCWSWDELSFLTNWDGSQDEGDTDNEAVLDEFFAPFAGERMGGLDGHEVRLIAINEGRLLDFLDRPEYRTHYAGLRAFATHALDGKMTEGRAVLVNLNLRSVVAGGPETSLLGKQLQRFLEPSLWQACRHCGLKERCPIFFNVQTLSDAASGAIPRERLHRLFEVVHVRRKLHVTMRDLRSALAWLLLRDQSCEDIAKLLSGPRAADVWRLQFSESFGEEDRGTEALLGRQRTTDRLVQVLKETDVGLVDDPALDRRLSFEPGRAVPWLAFDDRSPKGLVGLEELTRTTDFGNPPPDKGVHPRDVLRAWRRKAYFERRDEAWATMLPHRSFALLRAILFPKDDADRQRSLEELRDSIIDAMTLSEGLRDPLLRKEYLALRVTRIRNASARSYRLFPKTSFELRVPKVPSDFFEASPDTLELTADPKLGRARLKISLDLLETLEHIRHGYRPTASELQGLFVNLLIFRNELMSVTYDRILVTVDEREFFEIRASRDAQELRLDLSKMALGDAAEGTR